MLPNSPEFNAASLEVMDKVNFASMHSFLLLSSDGVKPDVFRCHLLTPAEIWVKSALTPKDGCSMNMTDFADFLRAQYGVFVFTASSPDFKSQVTDMLQKVKVEPSFVPDFFPGRGESPAPVYDLGPALNRGSRMR